jgi:RNA polymerase subunit RPABC4/transcription elongation factor Spt4
VHTKHEFSPPEPFLRFSQQTCPIHYFRSKTHVWGGFVQFRCRTSTIPKTGVGVHTKHEFSPPEPILRFSQRTCPIHYFRSKTYVWCGFALFRCRTSPIPKTDVGVHTKHEFLPPKPFLRFSQQTCPIHYFRSKTHVWVGFAQFRCRTSPILKTDVIVDTKHEFSPPEPFLRFSQRTCPIHYYRSKTHVWGGFVQFRCRTSPIPKTGVSVHTSTSFCHQNHFFVLRNEHAESTTLGPKLMFGLVSRNFVAARHPFRKRVSGAYKDRVFATGTISSFFATNMPNPLL